MKKSEYKGYTVSIEHSKEDGLFYGKLPGIKSLISYEGKTGPQLEKGFITAVDDYIIDCNELGVEKPFKGSFNVRISSQLHRDAALKAMELKTSLNGFVSESLRSLLATK